MFLLLAYVSIAIGVSFICSVLEAVLLSITPSYLAQLRQQQHPAADKLTKLKADIDRPLASILTLNTIAHTIGAATAGAQAAVVFGSEWLGVFSGVLTLGILVHVVLWPPMPFCGKQDFAVFLAGNWEMRQKLSGKREF